MFLREVVLIGYYFREIVLIGAVGGKTGRGSPLTPSICEIRGREITFLLLAEGEDS